MDLQWHAFVSPDSSPNAAVVQTMTLGRGDLDECKYRGTEWYRCAASADGECCSAELGRYAIYIFMASKTILMQMSRKSHETHPTLPPPTPASFTLDFAQLLQATTANPASRPRAKRLTHHTASGVARERIEESAREDEDWDLVDDDV